MLLLLVSAGGGGRIGFDPEAEAAIMATSWPAFGSPERIFEVVGRGGVG
ncbi:MAG: hypothetical protein M3680_25740 [Myxococcota bacterium]|nr:hypothetical protein [Myxococcota bacterium]